MFEEFGKAYWEERYRGHAAAYDGRPNPQLVAEAGELAPGTALDAGCGEEPTPSGSPRAAGG